MIRAHYQEWQRCFDADHVNFWSNLSRFNNLMGIVGTGVLIPTIRIRWLWYYWIFLAVEMLALYYLVASMIYWVDRLPK